MGKGNLEKILVSISAITELSYSSAEIKCYFDVLQQIINLVAPHLLVDHLDDSGTYSVNDGSNVIRRVLEHGTDT